MSTSPVRKALNIKNINPHLLKAQYAVRGELAQRSEVYRQQLAVANPPPADAHSAPLNDVEGAQQNGSTLPFDAVISANIGNPQQLDQKPITFFRQVLSILEYPTLLEKEGLFPEDVRERARVLLKEVGSVGAYSQSQGCLGIRQSVANFIEARDGYPADPRNIFLTAGASSGVNTLLNTICSHPATGVLIPIPQYPLYTATLALVNAAPVPYFLNEATAWSTDAKQIRSEISKAKVAGTDLKCLVVINPGNPTGATLTESGIEEVIALAAEEHLVIMADEVYQTNVYSGKFHSFKKVLRNMQKASPGVYDHVELVSFHSVSKGMVGECGHRGGYFELVGFDPEVQAQIYKLVSITLCPPVTGQCLVELMVNPPAPGSPSHDLYEQEYSSIFEGLKLRSRALHSAFLRMEGVECQDPLGAMYLFPTITLPTAAVKKAREEGRRPDEFYCMRLLEATGICVVPGSGFGQREGEWHFRTTFLAPGVDWVGKLEKFHEGFMNEFR
ncbi:PLP-dependent transferase [Choiromyces venosus 120613-1]|uniref:Glutamate pyruvate transaminase n=1 Tax=Choiromyces venosus 120613-1 TaxID=1336337 RepID=A0A3N4JQD9_9PEZI|nr:PLP-dependent transferase [Choiromyces venosus 120613-1]